MMVMTNLEETDGEPVRTFSKRGEWTLETLKEFMDERHRGYREALAREREERRERDIKNNEFRGQLTDQAATFVPRVEMEAKMEGLSQRLEAELKSISEKIQAKNAQVVLSLGAGLVAILITVFNFASTR